MIVVEAHLEAVSPASVIGTARELADAAQLVTVVRPMTSPTPISQVEE